MEGTETQQRPYSSNNNYNHIHSNYHGVMKPGSTPTPQGAPESPAKRAHTPFKPEPWSCNGNGNGNGDYRQWIPPASAPSASPWRGDSPPPLVKIRCGSPTVQKSYKVLANRDKESLMEEIITLKKALHEQAQILKVHKIHAVYVESENRKLEKDIEELELHGNVKASRTGNTLRLRSKLQGLKTRLSDLQSTCKSQQEELLFLKRDIRITRLREVETERDLYAEEIGRLQKVVKRLKVLHNRLYNENKQLSRYRDRAAQLDIINQRLESAVAIMQENLQKSNKEVLEYRQKANGYKLRTKKCGKKSQEIEEQNLILEKLVEDERALKQTLENKVHELSGELRNIRKHLMKAGLRFERVDASDVSESDYSGDWRSDSDVGIIKSKSSSLVHEQKSYVSEVEDVENYVEEACSQGTSKSSAAYRTVQSRDGKVKMISHVDPAKAGGTKGHNVVVPKLDLGQVNAQAKSGDPAGEKCNTIAYESSSYSTTDTEDVGYDSGLEMIMRLKEVGVVNSNIESPNFIIPNSFKETLIVEDDGKGHSANREDERSPSASETGDNISGLNRGGENHAETSEVSKESGHDNASPITGVGNKENDYQIVRRSSSRCNTSGHYLSPELCDSPACHRKLSLESSPGFSSVSTCDFAENTNHSFNITSTHKMLFNSNNVEKDNKREEAHVQKVWFDNNNMEEIDSIGDQLEERHVQKMFSKSNMEKEIHSIEKQSEEAHLPKMLFGKNNIEGEIDSIGEQSEEEHIQKMLSNINNMEREIDCIGKQSEEGHSNPGGNNLETLKSNNIRYDALPCAVKDFDQKRPQALSAHRNSVHFSVDDDIKSERSAELETTPCCITWSL